MFGRRSQSTVLPPAQSSSRSAGALGWPWLSMTLVAVGVVILWWSFHNIRLDNAYLVPLGIVLVVIGVRRFFSHFGWFAHRNTDGDGSNGGFDLFGDRP